MILARITSQYGDVYFLAIDSSVCRSSLERFMLNGLFLGIRDTIPPMQAYQIMSQIRLSKYVTLFPNGCTKLAARRGFRMRKVSRYTESLSGHRLMTQLEITASAKSSGKYDSAKSPTTNSTKSVRPASATACVARSIIGCAKSTTTTFPPGAILRAAKMTSMPAPHPKSTTTSPTRRSAKLTGLPQPLESLTASSETDAKSSGV